MSQTCVSLDWTAQSAHGTEPRNLLAVKQSRTQLHHPKVGGVTDHLKESGKQNALIKSLCACVSVKNPAFQKKKKSYD